MAAAPGNSSVTPSAASLQPAEKKGDLPPPPLNPMVFEIEMNDGQSLSFHEPIVPLSPFQHSRLEKIEEPYRKYYVLTQTAKQHIDKLLHGMMGAKLRRLLVPVLLLKRAVVRRKFLVRARKDYFPTEADCHRLFMADDLLSCLPAAAQQRLITQDAKPIVYTASQVIQVKREKGSSSGVFLVGSGSSVLVTSRLEQRYHHQAPGSTSGGGGKSAPAQQNLEESSRTMMMNDRTDSITVMSGGVDSNTDLLSQSHQSRRHTTTTSSHQGGGGGFGAKKSHKGGGGTNTTGSEDSRSLFKEPVRRHWLHGPCILGAEEVIGDAPFDTYRIAVSHDSASGQTVEALHIPAAALWREVATACAPPRSLNEMIEEAVREKGGKRKNVDEKAIQQHRNKIVEGSNELQKEVLYRRVRAISRYFPLSIPAVKHSWLCDPLPHSGLSELIRLATPVSFAPGTDVVEKGKHHPYLYFLMKGSLLITSRVEKHDQSSGGGIDEKSDNVHHQHAHSATEVFCEDADSISLLRPGMTFGEMSVIFGECRSTTLTVPPETYADCWRIHKDDLGDFMKGNDDYRQLLQEKAARVRETWLKNAMKDDFRDFLMDRLRKMRIFSHWEPTPLPETFFESIIERLEPRVYPQRSIVASTSQVCDRIVFIVRGVAKVVRKDLKWFPAFTNDSEDLVLGEPCLRPHRWPLAVNADTILDCFELSRRSLMECVLQLLEYKLKRIDALDGNPTAQFDSQSFGSAQDELQFWLNFPVLEEVFEDKSASALRILCHRAKQEEGIIPPTTSLNSYAKELRSAVKRFLQDQVLFEAELEEEERRREILGDISPDHQAGNKDFIYPSILAGHGYKHHMKIVDDSGEQQDDNNTRESMKSARNGNVRQSIDRTAPPVVESAKPLTRAEKKELMNELGMDRCPPNLFFIKRSIDRCKQREKDAANKARRGSLQWGSAGKQKKEDQKRRKSTRKEGRGDLKETSEEEENQSSSGGSDEESEAKVGDKSKSISFHSVAAFDPDLGIGVSHPAYIRKRRAMTVERPVVGLSSHTDGRSTSEPENSASSSVKPKKIKVSEFHKMFRQDGGFMTAAAAREASIKQDYNAARVPSRKGAAARNRLGLGQRGKDGNIGESQDSVSLGMSQSAVNPDAFWAALPPGSKSATSAAAHVAPPAGVTLKHQQNPESFFSTDEYDDVKSSSSDPDDEEEEKQDDSGDETPDTLDATASGAIDSQLKQLNDQEEQESVGEKVIYPTVVTPSPHPEGQNLMTMEDASLVIGSPCRTPSSLAISEYDGEEDSDYGWGDADESIDEREEEEDADREDTNSLHLNASGSTVPGVEELPRDALNAHHGGGGKRPVSADTPLSLKRKSRHVTALMNDDSSDGEDHTPLPSSGGRKPKEPRRSGSTSSTTRSVGRIFGSTNPNEKRIKPPPVPVEYSPPRTKTPLSFPTAQETDDLIHLLEQQIDLDELTLFQQQQQQKLALLAAANNTKDGGGVATVAELEEEEEQKDYVDEEWRSIAKVVDRELIRKYRAQDAEQKKLAVFGSSSLGGQHKPFPRAPPPGNKKKNPRRTGGHNTKGSTTGSTAGLGQKSIRTSATASSAADDAPISLAGLSKLD